MGRWKRIILLIVALIPSASRAWERSAVTELTEFQFRPLEKKSGQPLGEWLPATVPGDVISDLFRNGKVPDPYRDFNSREAQWVNDRDWLYAADFQFTPSRGAGALTRVYLLFMGVDYRSKISLNGRLLAEHEGMFSRIGPLDITDLLKSDGRNRLEVVLFGIPDQWAEKIGPKILQSSELGRRGTLKTQMSFGWDFAPRLKGAGIWDKVYVYETGPVSIRDIFIKPHLDGRIDVEVELKEPPGVEGTMEIDIAGENFSIKPIRECIALEKGQTVYRLPITLPDPRLWWPWDMGDQNLYRATATVAVFTDRWIDSDSVSEVFGVREIAWAPNPGAPANSADWVLMVNGRREFLRGGNWVPAEALLGRLTDERYRRLVSLAREANLNLLRVWGGGNREWPAFYDACDRAGIMVWQEFPLACVYIVGYPKDQRFLGVVRQETEEMVRQLRNHPGLIMWCGGNEWNVKKSPEVAKVMAEVVAGLDPTRRFVPASPYKGDSHNWVVWHMKGNLSDYFQDHSPLPSEFGLQAYPAEATLRQYLSPDLVWPIGEAHAHHNLGQEKMEKYSAPLHPADNLSAVIEASQVMQAHYLQRGIEFWRQRKYQTSGTAFWQFNEPWPAICWSVLDYELKPKLAYLQMKDTYNPLLVSAQFADKAWQPGDLFSGRIILVNDYPIQFNGLSVKVKVADEVMALPAELLADAVLDLGEVQLRLPAQAPAVLELTVEQDGQVLAKNRYDLSVCDPVPASGMSRRLEKWGKYLMSGAKPEPRERSSGGEAVAPPGKR